MIKIADLINDFAERFGEPVATVKHVARLLREDGLLPTGARGVNAPAATRLDAARLLLALMVRPSSSGAPASLKHWGAFVTSNEGAARAHQGWDKLEDALAWLFDYFSKHQMAWNELVHLEVHLDGSWAVIIFRQYDEEDNETYRESYIFEPKEGAQTKNGFGLTPRVMPDDLQAIGQLFADNSE